MSTIADQIHDCGWTLEKCQYDAAGVPMLYRASHGHFFTQWRPSPELVLLDLKTMKTKQGEAS